MTKSQRARRRKRPAGSAHTVPPTRRQERWAGVMLFVVALGLRLLFWLATPDASWPHSAHFKGDAPTWIEYAASLRSGAEFELGLPLRPPGAGYLLAAVWDGRTELWPAQVLWSVLGALTVALVYLAVLRSFGFSTALLTGLSCALSHGLMVLSTSLNNETPYLFLVAVTLRLWPARTGDATASGGRRFRTSRAWLWGVVNALACLVRVEHLLVFVLSTAALVSGLPRGARRRPSTHIAAAFGMVLLPWHLSAWAAIDSFNHSPSSENAATAAAQAQLEEVLADVAWTPEAAAARERMPAFARRAAGNFVAATVLYREAPTATMAPTVGVEDLEVLDQAFGSRPEPLPAHPFVTFYGGINFYLAHNPWASAGFSRALLDRPPPLDGAFPPLMVAGLPPPTLALTYPPHLHAVVHGYSEGLRFIASEPSTTLRRSAARALRFWNGAALGFGGSDLPFGTGGIRHRADLATPAGGAFFRAWQAAWLALALTGLWLGLRTHGRDLAPWLALAATKLGVSLAFFGYARHGAATYPVLALLAALAIVGLARRPRLDGQSIGRRGRLLIGVGVVCLVFLSLETWRVADPPSLTLDGRIVSTADPWPVDIHEDRRLAVAK